MKEFLCLFSFCPLDHSTRVVVTYKGEYMHKVLVNRSFKLAQENVWLSELSVLPRS